MKQFNKYNTDHLAWNILEESALQENASKTVCFGLLFETTKKKFTKVGNFQTWQ